MVGGHGQLVGVLHQHAVAVHRAHRERRGRRGGRQQGIQAILAFGVKDRLEIAADEGAHLQRPLVIPLAVLRRADVHPHQNPQFGLQAKTLPAALAVHFAHIRDSVGRAVAVFHPVVAVQVGSRLHPGNHEIRGNAVAVVRHRDVFHDFHAHVCQPLGGIQHSLFDFRGQRLFHQFAALGAHNAEIVGGKPHPQAADVLFQRREVIGHGHGGGGGVVWVASGNHLQHQRRVAHAAGDGAGGVQRRAEGNQPIAGNPPVGRLQAHHAAERGGLADGARGVGA